MSIKYKSLSDRLPKKQDIEIDLPGGAQIKFVSPLKFKDGKLFELLERMEKLDETGVSGIQTLIDDMAVDPVKLRKSINEDPEIVDADMFGIFALVGEEYGKQMGTLGESKA